MSVAVLYFSSLSRDSNDVLLADGFTEELSARLGQLDSVLVRSRGLVQRYRGTQPDPITVGRALNTAYVVSGTFRRSADRVRVTAELARTADGTQVWADVFERSNADLMGIEGELARAVAGGIAGRLAPREQARLARRPTLVPAAWEAYLRGNVLIARRYAGRLNDAVASYRQAVRLDPAFAAAWGRLAEALVLAPLYDRTLDARVTADSARRAAERAMRLDSLAPESWIAIGITDPAAFGPGPIAAFSRAVALDSNLAEARDPHGTTLGHYTADAGSAERHLRAAHRLDPSLANAVQRLGIFAWRQGRFFEALAWFDTLAAGTPEARGSALWSDSYVDALFRSGDTAAARREVNELLDRRGSTDSAWAMTIAARTLLLLGDTVPARRWLDAAVASTPASAAVQPGCALAATLATFGRADEAMVILERYRARGEANLWHMLRAPYFEPLRRDARFVRLLEATWPQ